MITNFSIFKNLDKKEEKHPDYKLSAKFNDIRGYEDIGAAWTKKTKPSEKFPEGRPYLSVQLNKKYALIIDQAQLGFENEVKADEIDL